VCLRSADVFAPLPKPSHLQRHIQIFPPLGFDNDNSLVGQLDHEIRVVVGDVAGGVYIVRLEMHGQVVFRVRELVRENWTGA